MKTKIGNPELPPNNETDFPLVVVTKAGEEIPMTLAQLKKLLKAQTKQKKNGTV